VSQNVRLFSTKLVITLERQNTPYKVFEIVNIKSLRSIICIIVYCVHACECLCMGHVA